MTDFSHLLNWRLLSGSHEFPGPNGGTCINEAAIVAAGFAYCSVNNAEDCPPCFSRPIASYAIGLNDRMPDELRQELLIPFVTRLAGTADTPEIERSRVHLVAVRTVTDILTIMLRELNETELVEMCRAATTVAEARSIASAVYTHMKKNAYAHATAADRSAAAAHAAASAHVAIVHATDYAAHATAYAINSTAYVVNYTRRREIKKETWQAAVSILDAAIKAGKHGDDLDHQLVCARMEKVKRVASVTG